MSCITRIRFQSKDEANQLKYLWIRPKIPYQANDAENLAKNYAISEKISPSIIDGCPPNTICDNVKCTCKIISLDIDC